MKIGLIGLGHLGKIHLKCLRQIDNWNIVGYYDVNPDVIIEGLEKFDSPLDLLQNCDAIDIVSSTSSHYKLIELAITMDKHVFVEKPMCSTYAQAVKIERLMANRSCILQVGHVERYNPAITSIKDLDLKPVFIDVDRLAPFNLRGTDVSVVMDLMIHDLDIILDLVKDEVVKVDANGIAIVSEAPDICNARIEFKKGCVANVTASRISMKQMRKIRIFQKDAYVNLDFLTKKSQIIQLKDEQSRNMENGIEIETALGKRYIQIDEPETFDSNAIKNELEDFYNSIVGDIAPLVGIKEASAAIDLAERISQSVELNVKKLKGI